MTGSGTENWRGPVNMTIAGSATGSVSRSDSGSADVMMRGADGKQRLTMIMGDHCTKWSGEDHPVVDLTARATSGRSNSVPQT